VKNLLSSTDSIHTLAVSDSGERIAAGTGTGAVEIWDAFSGAELAYIRPSGHRMSGTIDGLSFLHRDESTLVASWGHKVCVICAANCEPVAPPSSYLSPVTCVARAPNGVGLAYGFADGAVQLRPLGIGEPEQTALDDSELVSALEFTPSGDELLSGSLDGHVCLWSADSAKKVETVFKMRERASCLAFSPDGSLVAGGGPSQTVYLFDLSTRRQLARLDRYGEGVRGVQFSTDGKRLFAVKFHGGVLIWDIGRGGYSLCFQVPGIYAATGALSPDGSLVATGGLAAAWFSDMEGPKTELSLWDSTDGRRVSSTKLPMTWETIAFSRNGEAILLGCSDRTVHRYRTRDLRHVGLVEGFRMMVDAAPLDFLRSQLVFSRGTEVVVRSEENGKELAWLSARKVEEVKVGRNGSLFAFTSSHYLQIASVEGNRSAGIDKRVST